MPDYRLRIGMLFVRRGREHRIERQLGNGEIKVRDTATDVSTTVPAAELIEELFAGQVELIGEGNWRETLKEKLGKTRVTDISQLADNDPVKIEIVKRFHYVKELVSAQPLPRTKKNLTRLIQRVSQSVGDPRPPSWVSVNRWFRAYESAGRDVRALISSYKARGNRKPKISGRVPDKLTEEDHEKARVVSEIIDRVIRTKYLTRERPSVQSVYDTVVDRVAKDNCHRDAHDQLPIPHISTLYKVIKKLDRYEVDRARYGKKYADEKHRANGQGPRPSRPLERVECDHTKVDMMVIDEKTRLPLGRPWLTAIVDVYTKMILGIYLSFHRPGSLSAMQCLLHAVRPKAYVRTLYSKVQHDWPTYGIPELIVVDNAREFHGANFRDACQQLGIEVDYSPPGCAWFRATVERWFGTLNKSLLHELPGTTFSNIFEKEDYDPQKHAVISLERLLEIIHIWIIDIYHQRRHKGIQDVPHRRWIEAVAEDPPNLPPSSDDLKILLGFVEHRSVSRSGVELFSLLYNCGELSLIRRGLGDGEKVLMKYDPTDISVIYVWDAFNDRFIPVPALDQEYTRGLTIWQHHVIRRYARRLVQDYVDIVALCRAKAIVQEIVESERHLTGRVGGMQKIAHYLNIGQPNYQEDTHSELEAPQETQPRQLPLSEPTSGALQVEIHVRKPEESEAISQAQSKETAGGVTSNSNEDSGVPEEGWESDYDLPTEE
jgi:putative transposase